MDARLSASVLERGSEELAADLSDQDADFILNNFDFDKMAQQLRADYGEAHED